MLYLLCSPVCHLLLAPRVGPRKSPRGGRGLPNPRGPGLGVLGQGDAPPQVRGAAGEETPTADQEEQRRCTGPAQARGGGSTCVLGPGRPPSVRPDALAPPAPRSGRACPGVSPHRAIGPAADVGRGQVGLGQLPGGLVDVLLVEALFPGEAHPAHTIPAAPVRRLRSLPARFPAPGPLPRSPLLPPRSAPARGRGRPAARPTCPFAQVRPRPGLPRQPSP